MRYLIIFMLLCGVAWGEQTESRTVYLSQDELRALNDGRSVYRWYDEDMPYGIGNKFMDEVRPPKQNEHEK